METRYRALRIISRVYGFFGVTVLVLGTIAALLTAFTPSYGYSYYSGLNLWAGISLELGVLIAGIGLLAFAQLVQLLLDLEENTRSSAESQRDQVKLLKMLVRQGQGGQQPMPVKRGSSDFPEF